VKLRPPTSLDKLAADLGIKAGQLERLRVKYKTPEALLSTLQEWWLDTREQPRLLAKSTGYVHERFYALGGQITEEGFEDEPEAVDPAEIETYRASREARLRHQEQRQEDAGELLVAMENLRAAIDEMPGERKRRMSRTLWTLRSRLDSAERELRRRNAA
jgi:hypothetical protein